MCANVEHAHAVCTQKHYNGLAMIYTIAAIQRLKLRFYIDAVSAHSAGLLLRATRILQQIINSQPHNQAQAQELASPQSTLTHNMLCTWRPTYCIDIFLYFGADRKITVGLPMQTDERELPTLGLSWRCHSQHSAGKNDITSGNKMLSDALQHQTLFTHSEWQAFGIANVEPGDYITVGDACYLPDVDTHSTVEIKYFAPEIDASDSRVDIPECVCFAHLTCDTDNNDNHTMVALVYDILTKDNTPHTRERYEYLRSMTDLLSTVTIGEACIRVQWAGDPCMHDRLQDLVLPHAHDTIVLYGNHHTYSKYALDFGAPRARSSSPSF